MRYVFFALLVVGCSRPAPTIPATITRAVTETKTTRPAGVPEKTYTRDAFKALVIGKTKEEIKKAVGTPDEMPETDYRDTWGYRNTTYAPDGKNYDRIATIYFKDGKAERVDFY